MVVIVQNLLARKDIASVLCLTDDLNAGTVRLDDDSPDGGNRKISLIISIHGVVCIPFECSGRDVL